MKDIKTCKEYLRLFRISDKEYLLGIFQTGITIFKQQVRALNLFSALMQTGELKKEYASDPKYKIAVIGGGVGGLTFAAIAQEAGFNTVLFETKKHLMHLQRGCHTRTVHPYSYDWPCEGSEMQHAQLPVLSWKADTASNVAKEITNKFIEITNRKSKSKNVYTEADILDIYENRGLMTIVFKQKMDSCTAESAVNLIIYAPGYGIERNLDKYHTPSYWRNDDLGQLLVTNEKDAKHFHLWGLGDGGLIDLFRLTVEEFDVDALMEVFAKKETFGELKKILIEIKEDWEKIRLETAEEQYPKNWLCRQFRERINQTLYQHVITEYVLPGENQKVNLTVYGKEDTFQECLMLHKASLLNTFFAYILDKQRKFFNYKNEREIKETFPEAGKAIARHGTDRLEMLKALKIGDDVIARLKREQEGNYLLNYAYSLWEYPDIVGYFDKKPAKHFEFFTTETVSICSNFISVLAEAIDCINKKSSVSSDFRVALHRVIMIENEPHYQQICSYFGTKASDGNSLGSVYKVTFGNVGVSYSSGEAILIKNNDTEDFARLLEFLNLNGSDYTTKGYNTFFTLPILGKIGGEGLTTSNLILFIDAISHDFFDQELIIPMIYDCTKGFVKSIEKLLETKQISMAGKDFAHKPISGQVPIEMASNKCFKNLSGEFPYLKSSASELKFNEFYSFNISHNKPAEFLLSN